MDKDTLADNANAPKESRTVTASGQQGGACIRAAPEVSRHPAASQDLPQPVRAPTALTIRLCLSYMRIWQRYVIHSWPLVSLRVPIYLCFPLTLNRPLEKGGIPQVGSDLLWLEETESICR